jgi:hypothetical protein
MEREFHALPIGKGEILVGATHPNVALLAVGTCVYPAVEAAKRLLGELAA